MPKPATKAKLILMQRGITITALAVKIGKTRQAVSSSVNGSEIFPVIRRLIAQELKFPESELFAPPVDGERAA